MLTIEVNDIYEENRKIIVMVDQIEYISEYRGLATIRMISGRQIEVYHGADEVRQMIESTQIITAVSDK